MTKSTREGNGGISSQVYLSPLYTHWVAFLGLTMRCLLPKPMVYRGGEGANSSSLDPGVPG